jgi:phospholipid/cholesterol/gamma-HCH transport system ATP-binding protein
MSRSEWRSVKQRFSYMFQANALFDSMTVFENIGLPLRERTRLGEKEIHKQVLEKMEQLDLRGVGDNYPSQLSGGMSKRVALARALVTDPEIVLFDEPTTGLDPIRKNAVHSMISDYQKRFNFTGVVVSHEIPDIFFISQRVAMLDHGRIIFEGDTETIQRTDDPEVQAFIHGMEPSTDEMTGMATQHQGARRFEEDMARLDEHNIAFTLVVMTLTNMEEINETLGHVTGQTVMKNFAVEVQKRLRITDTCSRYRLNKIMIVLVGSTISQAREFCEQLTRDLKANDIIPVRPHPDFCFSIKAGFAEAEQGARIEEVLSVAEARAAVSYEFKTC